MTEIFYRLLSQTNGNFYTHQKDERYSLVAKTVQKLKLSSPKYNFTDLNLIEVILKKYDRMELVRTKDITPISERRALANECLLIKKDVFDKVANEIKHLDFKTISNEDFMNLIRSELADYLRIAIFMSECRNKLLEFLLFETK